MTPNDDPRRPRPPRSKRLRLERALLSGSLLLALIACVESFRHRCPEPPPAPHCQAPEPPPPPAPPPAPEACTRAEERLASFRQLGKAHLDIVQDQLAGPHGPDVDLGEGDVPAIGACTRPDPALRATMKAAVERWIAEPSRRSTRALDDWKDCAKRPKLDTVRFACMAGERVLLDIDWREYCSEAEKDEPPEMWGSAILEWNGSRLRPFQEDMSGVGEWAYQGSVSLIASVTPLGGGRTELVFSRSVGEGGGSEQQRTLGVVGAPWKPQVFGAAPDSADDESLEKPPGEMFGDRIEELTVWLQRPIAIHVASALGSYGAGRGTAGVDAAWKLTNRGFVRMPRAERAELEKAWGRLRRRREAAELVSELELSAFREDPARWESVEPALTLLDVDADRRAELRSAVTECLAQPAR